MYPVPTRPVMEWQRLALLRDLALVERPLDRLFQRVVDLAAQMLDAPMAMVCFLEEHELHCKAPVGVPPVVVPRQGSFCDTLIAIDAPLQVSDAHADPRFADNPAVRGAPFIRFYAGVPLRTADSLVLGSLCLLDSEPWAPLTLAQLAILEKLAGLASEHIEQLRTGAYLDTVTQLPNHQRFLQDGEAMIQHGQATIAVVADLFGQGFLNDFVNAMGTTHLDELQKAMKAHLRGLLPTGLPLYKLGPARYGFLLTGPAIATHDALFRRLQQALNGVLDYNGIPLQARLGLGVLVLDEQSPADWLRALIATADNARAEMRGCRYFDEDEDAAYRRAFTLLSALPQALHTGDQLQLVFQPRIDLASGRCRSVEALLRWEHPQLGPVSPAEFVPLAEKTALITALSAWVIERGMLQAERWQQENNPLGIAINISARDLSDPQFIPQTQRLLERIPLDPRRLEFEVTESAVVSDDELALEQLGVLRRLGIGIAIDDFGTGYNNLSHLRGLPADTVKIDRSFVSDLASEHKDRLIVASMIELAHELGFRITAEGIETTETLASLLAMGCDEGQGFWIGKPMTSGELNRWLLAQQPRFQRLSRNTPLLELFDGGTPHQPGEQAPLL